MFQRMTRQVTGMIAGVVLLVVAMFFGAHMNSRVLTAQAPDSVAAPAAVSQVLSYQGRLVSPSTGLPQPDGDYQMTFSIYNVATGGTPLWTETKSVPVSSGFFAALLGDTTPLVLANFDGQELFLGITLTGDAEMTPRQRLAHVAYAMHAETAGAATLAANATNATNAVNATNATNAGTLDGLQPADFAAASHTHDGAAINAGTVAEARIDAAITRDGEVFPLVLLADGPGSGLNADLLDGIDSSGYFLDHRGTQFNGTLGSSASQVVTTHSWPLDWNVHWVAVPTTTGGEVSLTVSTLLEANGLYTYRLTVTNLTASPTNYSLRYSVFR
jgi:hypothetical protein